MINNKLKSYFIANKLKYSASFWGLLYNLIFSYKGRCIIYVYYISNNDNILSSYLRRILKKKYHFEVGKYLDLGQALVLNHPYNIIIDSYTTIGDNCQVDQNVTIGGNMKREVFRNGIKYIRPVIGNNVILCAGCVIAGPITIGDSCIIGANATVTHDVTNGKIFYNVGKMSARDIVVKNGTYTTST